MELVDTLKALTDIQSWKFKYYGFQLEDLNIENLKSKYVLEESLSNFLYNSLCESFELTDDKQIIFKNPRSKNEFSFIDFGNIDRLTIKYDLSDKPHSVFESSNRDLHNKIYQYLGEGWWITSIDNYILIGKSNDDRMMVLV